MQKRVLPNLMLPMSDGLPDKITGDPGQKVKLTVLHDGSRKPVDVSISRAEINIESVLGDLRMDSNLKAWDFMLDKHSMIAYIRITNFAENTVADLTRVVDQLQADGVKGLILDLRTNPGGLLKAAIEMSELFLPQGTRVVSTVGRTGTANSGFDATANLRIYPPLPRSLGSRNPGDSAKADRAHNVRLVEGPAAGR